MARCFHCRNNRVWAAALVIGALAAQTRERSMQPSFYHSSLEDVRKAQQEPVLIQDAAARLAPVARAAENESTLRSYGNASRNSRLAYHAREVSHPSWQIELPSHFTPRSIMAAAGRIVVQSSEGWLLLDSSGRTLAQGLRGPGEIALDAQHGTFYAPTQTGFIAAYSLKDGRREYFLRAFFGEQYSRVLIERRLQQMLIVSIQRPTPPHSRLDANNSAIELQDLVEPFQFSDDGRLKSAQRTDYLMRKTVCLLPAVLGDTVVLATDNAVYVADFALKLQRELQARFHPLFLSIDETPRFYLLVEGEQHSELWMLTPAGDRVRVPLVEGFSAAHPPVVGFDHKVYLVGRDRVLAVTSLGTPLWDRSVEAGIAGAGITPEGVLVVASGSELLGYDAAGNRKVLFTANGDSLATAPAATEKGELLVAGQRRLYCLQ